MCETTAFTPSSAVEARASIALLSGSINSFIIEMRRPPAVTVFVRTLRVWARPPRTGVPPSLRLADAPRIAEWTRIPPPYRKKPSLVRSLRFPYSVASHPVRRRERRWCSGWYREWISLRRLLPSLDMGVLPNIHRTVVGRSLHRAILWIAPRIRFIPIVALPLLLHPTFFVHRDERKRRSKRAERKNKLQESRQCIWRTPT